MSTYSDLWCEKTIRLVMNAAVRSAKDYEKNKTQSNMITALEGAHNAIILARDDPVLSGELPEFVGEITACFDKVAKAKFEAILKDEKSCLPQVPEKLMVVVHNHHTLPEIEFWFPPSSRPVVHNHATPSEAEFAGPDKPVKDEVKGNSKPIIHQSRDWALGH
ncbi:hypothetical protein BBAD15_g9907 [Beauveria bassiana D1-5]|uniref:Uncharacterized protein n=1 Tax=Beauveria bassiana D1-5 TaxID=1245745 RepID=A0A0A2VFC8_BEABA|nr:hypothetical protein BBAD15_g9907 [Beauveria bassiana D1-5]